MIPSFTKALERKELRTVENLVLEFRITLVKVGDLVGKPLPLRFLPERIIFMIGIVRSIDQAKIDSSIVKCAGISFGVILHEKSRDCGVLYIL